MIALAQTVQTAVPRAQAVTWSTFGITSHAGPKRAMAILELAEDAGRPQQIPDKTLAPLLSKKKPDGPDKRPPCLEAGNSPVECRQFFYLPRQAIIDSPTTPRPRTWISCCHRRRSTGADFGFCGFYPSRGQQGRGAKPMISLSDYAIWKRQITWRDAFSPRAGPTWAVGMPSGWNSGPGTRRGMSVRPMPRRLNLRGHPAAGSDQPTGLQARWAIGLDNISFAVANRADCGAGPADKSAGAAGDRKAVACAQERLMRAKPCNCRADYRPWEDGTKAL